MINAIGGLGYLTGTAVADRPGADQGVALREPCASCADADHRLTECLLVVQALLDRVTHQFHPIVQLQLAERVLHVVLHGAV
ncbi:hypothetical protein CS0771_45050 [Catellatospora sp. IY07-71]|nr:hypothetical protein CS0771_45050 [Catellatospora sp. IY07-71]